MRKGNRERLLRQPCGNSVAKFGSASWNENDRQFFWFLCIVARISSLIYGTLFSPTRHRLPRRTPVSSLTEKNHSLGWFFRDDSICLEEILDWSSKTFIFCLYIQYIILCNNIGNESIILSKSYILHLASRTMFLFLVLISKHCFYNFFNINYRLYFTRNFQIFNCSFIARLSNFKRNLKPVLGIFPLSTSVLPSVAPSIPRLLASALVSDRPCLSNK